MPRADRYLRRYAAAQREVPRLASRRRDNRTFFDDQVGEYSTPSTLQNANKAACSHAPEALPALLFVMPYAPVPDE